MSYKPQYFCITCGRARLRSSRDILNGQFICWRCKRSGIEHPFVLRVEHIHSNVMPTIGNEDTYKAKIVENITELAGRGDNKLLDRVAPKVNFSDKPSQW